MKKRNRTAMGYRFWHWFHVRGWEELFALVFEIITGFVFFIVLFFFLALIH